MLRVIYPLIVLGVTGANLVNDGVQTIADAVASAITIHTYNLITDSIVANLILFILSLIAVTYHLTAFAHRKSTVTQTQVVRGNVEPNNLVSYSPPNS